MSNEPKKSAQEILAEIMLQEQARQAAERLEAQKGLDRRNTMRIKQDADIIDNKQRAQKNCDHRKATAKGPKPKNIDYNVYLHTFTNRVSAVKCNKCGMWWFQGSTKTELVDMNGKKSPNHTGISFAEAMVMAQEGNTTNKPSSAEVWITPPQATPTQ